MLNLKPKKRLGQTFLVNEHIAEMEAVHGEGKKVLELGPGMGMLTRKLCEKAKSVVAVEKDARLYNMLLATMHNKNLTLINADFFRLEKGFAAKHDIEILIANVPYNLSSKTIEWLIRNKMQAVLCLQKEFVDHMLAKPGSRNYSRLSVMSALSIRVTKIIDVKRGNFSPVPKVDSAVIYIKPNDPTISAEESEMINLLMQHKRKTLRNAIIDSRRSLGITKEFASQIAEKLPNSSSRPMNIGPEGMLSTAREIILLNQPKE